MQEKCHMKSFNKNVTSLSLFLSSRGKTFASDIECLLLRKCPITGKLCSGKWQNFFSYGEKISWNNMVSEYLTVQLLPDISLWIAWPTMARHLKEKYLKYYISRRKDWSCSPLSSEGFWSLVSLGALEGAGSVLPLSLLRTIASVICAFFKDFVATLASLS